MRKFRIGLIGAGGVGIVHLDAYVASSIVDVVAVSDLDPAALSRVRSTSVALYADAAKMLREQSLDIVCVLTPPATHEVLVKLCADRGIHILCEKPLAPDTDACVRMINHCESAGVRLYYGASYRFLPAVIEARRMIQDGQIGKIRLMRESVIGGGGPKKQCALPSGHYPIGGPGGTGMGLMDHGVHLVDLFAWLSSSSVVRAHGRGNLSGAELIPEHLLMEFSNGAIGMLVYDDGTFSTELPTEGVFSEGAFWSISGLSPAGSWDAHPGSIHIHGDAGSLRAFHYANLLFHTDAQGTRQIPIKQAPPPDHFRRQIDTFAIEIRDNLPASCPATDGLTAIQNLQAAYV